MRFIPTDTRFFDYLVSLARELKTATELLARLVAAPSERAALVRAIAAVEKAAGQAVHELTAHVNRSFQIPIDGEDVHALATGINHVIDMVHGTARRIDAYGITDAREAGSSLAVVLAQAAVDLEAAVADMRKPSAIRVELIHAIKVLEEKGDGLHEAAVSGLFVEGADPLYVLKWKDVFDRIEDAIDGCLRAARVIESVAVKHS